MLQNDIDRATVAEIAAVLQEFNDSETDSNCNSAIDALEEIQEIVELAGFDTGRSRTVERWL